MIVQPGHPGQTFRVKLVGFTGDTMSSLLLRMTTVKHGGEAIMNRVLQDVLERVAEIKASLSIAQLEVLCHALATLSYNAATSDDDRVTAEDRAAQADWWSWWEKQGKARSSQGSEGGLGDRCGGRS